MPQNAPATHSTGTMDRDAPGMDLVVTWCDSNDASWNCKRRQTWLAEQSQYPGSAIHRARYDDHGELRYLLRSVASSAPFIRRIFLVTDGQVPGWLKNHDRISIVHHRDLIPKGSVYPLYSSVAIESYLHHIDGLSDRFLYANDDTMFFAPVRVSDFIDPDGKVVVRMDRRPVNHPAMRRFDTYDYIQYRSARLFLSRYGKRAIPIPAPVMRLRDRLKQALHLALPIPAHGHQISVYSREACYLAEKRFSDAFATTRSRRFRSADSFYTLLLSAYISIVEGYGRLEIHRPDDAIYLSSADRPSRIAHARNKIKAGAVRPRFFCINSVHHKLRPAWDHEVGRLLSSLFPKPADWERHASTLNTGTPEQSR